MESSQPTPEVRLPVIYELRVCLVGIPVMLELSIELLLDARQSFTGACLMPPFGHYEIVGKIRGE